MTMKSYLWLLLFIIPALNGMSMATIGEFNVNNGSFSSYLDRLNMYFKVHNVTEDLKLPTMILLIGEDTYEILVNLAAPKNPTMLTYEEATELLNRHFQPSLAALSELCLPFRYRQQKVDETIYQYVEDLKNLSQKCNFGTKLGVHLRNQFVFGLKNYTIRVKLHTEDSMLTFVNAVKIATSLEASSGVKETEAGLAEFVVTKDSQDNDQQECPAFQAETPFTCLIHNGVFPGRVFRIRASTRSDAARFSINLQCGMGSFVVDRNNDLAIHIDFRFESDLLVRNTLIAARPPQGELWFTEARDTIPILKGEPFEITIVCEESSFKININGTQLSDYSYRIPIDRITHLLFIGDVMVHSVKIEDTKDNEVKKS